MKVRRVLVTGGTGFVGKHVLRALDAHDGVVVRAVVRDTSVDRLERLGSLTEIVSTPSLFKEPAQWWIQVLENVDTVLHLAWYAEPGHYLHSRKNLECLIGTLELARASLSAGVRRWVGVGTCLEYDLRHGWLSIDTPLRPETPYAAAKASAYWGLSGVLPASGVEFAWCRLFYLYGEGDDPRRLLPYVRSQLAAGQPASLTSGNQIRDFMDVADAARELCDIALGEHLGAVNVCSGIPITVRQLVEDVADEYGRRDLLRFGDRPTASGEPACVVGVRS